MKSFLTAGLALAACAALAGVEKQTFESIDVGSKPTGWTGDAAAVEASGESARGKVLAVDGTITCANSAGDDSQWGKTTFLVKAPVDATATADLPTADVIGENCQIAVATGEAITEGDDAGKLKVMVYQGTTAKWVEAQGVSVAKDAWFKVGLNFDYNDSKVQVLINDTAATTFFNLVTPLEEEVKTSKINSLAFVGSTKVDDVSIAEVNNVPAEALPETIKTLSINLAERGVKIAEINDTAKKYAGLTVAERLESGLAPKGSTTFTATAMGVGSITVPCEADNGQVYQVVITDGAGNAVATVAAAPGKIADGKRTLTFEMPTTDKKVLKFQVQASAPATTSAE